MKKREPIEVKWAKLAESLRAEAAKLPQGRARDALIKQARHLDSAAKMQLWISSPGLKPPEGN